MIKNIMASFRIHRNSLNGLGLGGGSNLQLSHKLPPASALTHLSK